MTLSAAVATAAALAASRSLAETAAAAMPLGSRGDSVWCTFRNFFSVTFILPAILERGLLESESGWASVSRATLLPELLPLAAKTTPFGSLCTLVAADADLLFTPLPHRAASNGPERTGLFFCSSWFSWRKGELWIIYPLFPIREPPRRRRGTPLIGAVQLTHTQQPHHRGRGRKPQFVFVRVGPTRVGGSAHEMDASPSMISPYQLPVTRHAIFSLAGISSPLHSAPQLPPTTPAPVPPPSIEMPTIILFRRSTLSSLLVCLHTFPFGGDGQTGRTMMRQ